MKNKTSRKIRVGRVSSAKRDKTITVELKTQIKHPLYGKFIKRTVKLAAHDEKNECQEGDLVKVIETRPLSRKKRWCLVEVVEKVK